MELLVVFMNRICSWTKKLCKTNIFKHKFSQVLQYWMDLKTATPT